MAEVGRQGVAPGPDVMTGDGARLRTYTGPSADGRSVLLIHGGVGSASDWDRVIDCLDGSDLGVVNYDQRGHGTSGTGARGLSVDTYGDDLASVVSELDLRDVLVVGHSMGGMAILSYIARHPGDWRERVSGVILISTPVQGLGDSLRFRLLTPLIRRGMLQWILGRRWLGRSFMRPMFGPNPARKLVDEARLAMQRAPRTAKVDAPLSVLHFDLTDSLRKLDVPTVVVVGSDDRTTTPEEARKVVDRLPDAELRVLPGVGHMVHLEQPGELARTIREFAAL